MTWLKNILLVSYLKNKGVWRICFVVGLLLSMMFLTDWIKNWHYNFYFLSFASLEEVQDKYAYNEQVLKRIFDKYPVNFGKNLNNFDNWKEFFINIYSGDYNFRLKFMQDCASGAVDNREICKKLENYIFQKITVNYHNWAYFLELWFVVLAFYLPFLVACILRWIYRGFQNE